MPELHSAETSPQVGGNTPSPFPMLSAPDDTFAKRTMDMAGRLVIIHYQCDPEDDGDTKRRQWQAVPAFKRNNYGRVALALNAHSIDWKGFDDIEDMLAAEDRLRKTNSAPATPKATVN